MEYHIINLIENRVSVHYYCLPEECLYASYSRRHDRWGREIVYLKCVADGCDCKAKVFNNTFTRTNAAAVHNHPNHNHQASYEKAYEELRNAVKLDRRSIRSLHAAALRSLSAEAAGMLSFKRHRRTLQRIRYSQLPSCQNLRELITHLNNPSSIVYKNFGMIRDECFYQGSTEGYHLVFSHRELIHAIPAFFDLYVDATFSVTPFSSITHQLLVVLAGIQHKPRPIIFVIMIGKTTEDYEEVFKFIRDRVISFDGVDRIPKTVTTDFEAGMRAGLRLVWPNVERIGCNFHFTQCLHRRAREIGVLAPHLTGNTPQHEILFMFKRLSLLPVNKVEIGFNALIDFITESNLEDDFIAFVQYFKFTWFTLFPKEDWCVGDREIRTNNHLEGYNNRIKQVIPTNPSVWDFLDGLIDLAYEASSEYNADVAANAPPPPSRSKLTKPLQANLLKLQEGSISELDFLKAMSSFH